MRIDFDAMRHLLRRSLNRRRGLAAGLVAAGAVGLLALPVISGIVPVPDRAACCSGAVAVGDSMISPSVGGDKDFFEVVSGPPTVVFLLGNNESMMEFTEWLPEVGDTSVSGCTDPALVSKMKQWFDIGDPAKDGATPIDADSGLGSVFFNPNFFYHSKGWRLPVNGTNSPDSWPTTLYPNFITMDAHSDKATPCSQLLGWWPISAENAECQRCLTEVGWWRGRQLYSDPSDGRRDLPPMPPEARRRWILSGRFLNMHPPKFVVARRVLKDVIDQVYNTRVGVATFGPDNGWFDPPAMKVPAPVVRPTCDFAFPNFNYDQFNRPALKNAINRVEFNNDERSIGEALFGLGSYFSSQAADGRWASWFQQPISPGYGWPGASNGGTIDNPRDPGQPGTPWANTNNEWLKSPPAHNHGGSPAPWPDWTHYMFEAKEGGGFDRSVCFPCQVSSVVVLTDGAPKFDNSVPITKMMEILKANGARHADGTPLTFDPSDPVNNLDSGGVNYCDLFGVTKEDCDYTDYNWPHGLARGNKNFMDDVAFFLANTDLRSDMPGVQSVRTHTIGYGDNSPMLQSIAKAGKGRFFRADSRGDLHKRIMEILDEIKEVATSFSAANISGVQTGGMQSSAYVPRFTPRRGRPYEGHLYRFFYYSEFAQGCEPHLAQSEDGDPRDLNGDKDCDDTFFLDKPEDFIVGPGKVPSLSSFSNLNIIQENLDGVWVKAQTAVKNQEGRLEGGVAAKPFWDLGETLGRRKASLPCNPEDPLNPEGGRCIFTLIDSNNDGKYTSEDTVIAFEPSQVGALEKYLMAAGDDFCPGLFARLQKVYTKTEEERKECAARLIEFVRGVDVFNYDDNATTVERPCQDDPNRSCKLADIFHSTPVTVEPPVEPFLCTLGLSSQCLSTLYSDFSASVSSEALCAQGGKPCYAPTEMDPKPSSTLLHGAYSKYRDDKRKRERILLVGSNGGMLHAVHAGSWRAEPEHRLDDPYDIGTGQELWAFIPPDLLPKLGLMVNGHEYYVDGTVMVRDIWSDQAGGSIKDTKEPQEFRTLAVISERSGGQRFLALDVTNPWEMLTGSGNRGFRWMWPNACDPESAEVGQSWSNFAPKPPPIGAVRLEKESAARGWEERWVVFLNGGYSPDLSRGAGLYMVDAWTGEKLWSAGVGGSTSAGDDTYRQEVLGRMMPIVASPALVDLGKAENVQLDMDGFFDTLIVGDMGGQVWTFRFQEPGKLDSNGQVTNWFGARSLEVNREDVSGGATARRDIFKKTPFFNIASNIVQPETGWLRSFLGTGDKQHLRSKVESSCGPDNLLACVRLKCDVSAEFLADINGRERKTVIEYDDGVLVRNEQTWLGAVGDVCSSSRMELTSLVINCPDSTTLGTGSFRFPLAGTASSDSECVKSGSDWVCSNAKLPVSAKGEIKLGSDAASFPVNRYYGFHSYGGTQRNFRTAAEASGFDQKRVTDIPFNCGTGVNCSLVDVTIPESAYVKTTDANGNEVSYLPVANLASLKRGETEGPGWFMQYRSLQEKTASGSTVLGGVVLWPSFMPPSGSVSVCSLQGAGDISRTWQTDVITGLPDMADGFRMRDEDGTIIGYLPFKMSKAAAPPADPTPVITMSKTGGIRFEVVMPGVGDELNTEKVNDRKNVTPDVYWLEVPRNLHACRHEGNCD